MNLQAMVDAVIVNVKRADKAAQIRLEINKAISFYVLDNEFSQDFVESSIVIEGLEYTQSFLLTDLTRFRKFKYLKRGGTKGYLTHVSNAEMLKGCDLRDRYYIAGTSCVIALSALAATLDAGYFSYPPMLTGTQTFWLTDISPFMVIDRASAAIFRQIGEEKSMNIHAMEAATQYMAFRKDVGISTQ